MKRIAILASFIFAVLLCSCEKTDEPDYPYYNDYPPKQYDLDQLLDNFKSAIDNWQTDNQYDESLLCGKLWGSSNIYIETYVDGELTETSDFPFPTSVPPEYFFNENHSMRYRESKGVWLYVSNRIIMRHDGSFYNYEVADVTQSSLLLKREEPFSSGCATTPFYIDKSGKHQFLIQEFQAK
ncbi:MAG: hypothetical protein J5639_06860 [Bacteroidales bacterium]|nr:hypothetical protein [Bacteroidales bacterium]